MRSFWTRANRTVDDTLLDAIAIVRDRMPELFA